MQVVSLSDLGQYQFFQLLSQASYIELLFSLADADAGVLPPFAVPRELVFAIGGDEVRATMTGDDAVRFEQLSHLADLEPTDLLTMHLFQNSDEANVLWEWGSGLALKIDSSGNPGSRENKSFNICTDITLANGRCALQQAITAELLFDDIAPMDSVVWEVEALEGNLATDDLDSSVIVPISRFSTAKLKTGNGMTNYTFTISSPWRHPERNERVNGVKNSKHQLGSAIDLVVRIVPGKTKAQLFCILETATDSIAGHTAFAEHLPTQRGCNDVGPTTFVTHVHTQVQ